MATRAIMRGIKARKLAKTKGQYGEGSKAPDHGFYQRPRPFLRLGGGFQLVQACRTGGPPGRRSAGRRPGLVVPGRAG
jgi:hypothetical protein